MHSSCFIFIKEQINEDVFSGFKHQTPHTCHFEKKKKKKEQQESSSKKKNL